jgi:hypothetical protein
MTNPEQVITINQQYDGIIEQGADDLAIIEAQATIAIWCVMKTVHDTCEAALRLLEKHGVAGRGQWKAQEAGNHKSMAYTYKSLAAKAGKSPSWVNNAHICFKKTLQFIGEEDSVIGLAIPPTVALAIVNSTKIQDEDKSVLLANAIREGFTKTQAIREIRILAGEEEQYPIFHTNLWNVKTPEPQFGMVYPGRLPGQIAYNVLHHYSEPGEMCLFPFVGGGTEADVAKFMGRDYFAWDINHVQEVAKEHKEKYFSANSLSPWAITDLLDKPADLVFADPPRFMWGDGSWRDAGDTSFDISTYDADNFIDAMELIGLNAHRALRIGGKFIMLLRQPSFINTPSPDLAFSLTNRLSQFELLDRVHVSFATTMHRPTERGVYATEGMDLLILEKR